MKKDNRGLTLVELLIAVTMLAVVISPFLNTFVASARQNNKARETLRATTVAQNLMEGVEAFTLEEVCTQVNSAVADTKLYMPNGYASHREVPGEDGKTSKKEGETDYVFESTPSNTYEFHIQGIEEDGQLYDARIQLDASGYFYVYDKNSEFQVSVMNETKDAILSISEEDDEKVLAEKGWTLAGTERVFEITVDKVEEDEEADEGDELTKVTIKVSYQKAGEIVEGRTRTKTLKGINNVYIMYYPNYVGSAMDKFEVTYNTDVPFNLCLVKQKYEEAKTDSLYRASLLVKDVNTDISDDSIPRITLRTNIPMDLYGNGGPFNNALAVTYNYGCVEGNSGTLAAPADIEKLLGYVNQGATDSMPQSLAGEMKSSNAIYTTTVQVFPEGTYEDNRFDSENPLAELSN